MFNSKVVPTTFTGLTAENYLRVMDPEKHSAVIKTYMSLKSDNMDWELFIKNHGQVITVETDKPIKQELVGIKRKNVKIVRIESIDEQRIGEAGAEFTVVFDHRLFDKAHTIVSKYVDYPIQIQTEAVPVSGGFSYRCKKFGIKPFIPAYVLEPGSEFGLLGAPTSSVFSMRGPSPVYSAHTSKEFIFSKIRTTDKIPGNMVNRPLHFSWINTEGKKFEAWDLVRSMEFESSHYSLKMNSIIHNRINIDGNGQVSDYSVDNKREITQGEGYLQQIEKGHIVFYNEFNIEEFGSLVDRAFSSTDVEYTENPVILVMTGSMGMQKASEAIVKLAYVDQVGLAYHGKQDKPDIYGISFFKYKTRSGKIVIFKHEKAFDDNSVPGFKTIDGNLALSSTFIFTPISKIKTSEGEMSTMLLYKTKRHGDYHGYMVGATGYSSLMSTIPAMKANPNKGVSVNMDMEEDAAIETRISDWSLVLLNPGSVYAYKPANVI